MAKRKPKGIKKWGGGSYAALPHAVLRSHGYANLSSRAVKLLNDLLSQYYGSNNGDLCAAMKLMRKRGWTSNSSLTKARKELLESGFLAESKQGGRNRPTLFSITFYSIDECKNNKTGLSRHEVLPTTSPANDWMKFEPDKPKLNLNEAQKKQRHVQARNNIIELKKISEMYPDDKYAKQTQAGIEYWESKQK